MIHTHQPGSIQAPLEAVHLCDVCKGQPTKMHGQDHGMLSMYRLAGPSSYFLAHITCFLHTNA